MKPKEKAEELLDKFRKHAHLWDCRNDEPCQDDHTRECALICVDEIMKDAESNCNEDHRNYEHSTHYKFWTEVRIKLNGR